MAYLPAVRSIVDSGNSTTAALGAAGVFTGSWEDIEVWNGVSVIISGTAASTAPGTLVMQFSHDGATVARAITVNVADVASASPRTLGTIARYFRLIYTNGGQAQTTFSLQTMLHSSQVNLVSRLKDGLDNVDVMNVRSVPSGQQPDGDYVNGKADGTAFAYETPLLAGGSYDSGWTDTDGWVSIELFISTDQLSAIGGIVVEFTDDVQGVQTVRATACASQGIMETCASLLRVRAMLVNAQPMAQNEPLETTKCVHSMESANAKLVTREARRARVLMMAPEHHAP